MTITEWIEALESGKFEQAQLTLRTYDGYCCLGVACELAGVEWEPLEFAHKALYKGHHTVSSLPTPLRSELGLTLEQQVVLTEMNDDGSTFPEIAAKLREWFPQ